MEALFAPGGEGVGAVLDLRPALAGSARHLARGHPRGALASCRVGKGARTRARRAHASEQPLIWSCAWARRYIIAKARAERAHRAFAHPTVALARDRKSTRLNSSHLGIS